MEENPGHEIKTQTDQSDLKDQLINSSGENEVTFPNDGSKEKAEDEKTQEGNSPKENTQVKESDNVTSDSKELLDKTTVDNEENSAEVNCPICLGLLQNKSFTDSCFHTFCFTCLLEWSKVKAECPLCKQKFKSIVHNVRSIEDYDQYFISQKNSEDFLRQLSSTFEGAARRFRYHSTVTAERMLQRRRRMVAIADSFESQYASHRLLYAPHSVRSYTSSEVARIPCNFRSGIYDTGLWVKPTHMHTTRTRDVSPAFYHENPACTHRLIPWLNRELVALLHDNESQVTFVLELIMALITRYDIQSQEFFVHIEPYLAPRTSHFVHEFYNFARSPYDMHRYDRCAVYSLSDQRSSTRSASPDSDVIPITEPAAVSNGPSTSREATSSRHTENERPVFRRLKKIVLKRNQESNLWQSVIHFQAGSTSTSVNSPTESVSSSFCLAGPSTSTYERSYKRHPSNSVNVDRNDDESDCLIVDEMPPKSQRTPEIISILSSDDDSKDQEKVSSRPPLTSNNNDLITLSSDENSVYNLDYGPSDTKYSAHSIPTYMFKSLSSDDDEKPRHPKLKTKHKRKKSWAREKRKTRPTSKSHSQNDIHSMRPKTPNSEERKEMPFLTSPSTSSSWPKHNELSSLDLPIDKSNKGGSSPSSTNKSKNSDAGTSALDASNKGDTGTSSMDTYKSNSSTSVADKSNKGDSCMVVTDSKAVDFGSSTDSYSEVLSDMSMKPKKAKLRSVVAQVSATEHQDRTDHHHHDRSDSSRHSLHKRHKEKHKKKKKHSHKHRHRSHSHETE